MNSKVKHKRCEIATRNFANFAKGNCKVVIKN